MTATQPLTETTVLANDVKMPTIGFGTWQIPINENFDSTIQTAIQLGYRQFDTAQIYNNAQRMGEAIRASDVPRSEFFLTSKIWASHRSYESAREAYEMILTQMQTDYLDLLLIHWPAAQGEPMVWQAQNAGAWRALEELYTEGRVRAIGVSNFLPHHLVPLLARARVKPMVNQLEIHAQVALRWCIERGIAPIPKSTLFAHQQENLNVFDFSLTPEEVNELTAMPQTSFSGLHPDTVTF